MADVAEMVLPSGRFAKMRPLTGRDYLVAVASEKTGLDLTFSLIAISVRVDDVAIKYQDLLLMDLRDVMGLFKLISPYISGPVLSSGTSIQSLPPVLPLKDS